MISRRRRRCVRHRTYGCVEKADIRSIELRDQRPVRAGALKVGDTLVVLVLRISAKISRASFSDCSAASR